MNLDGKMAPAQEYKPCARGACPALPTLLAWDLHGWCSSGLIPWDRHPLLNMGLRGSVDTKLTKLLPSPEWEQL